MTETSLQQTLKESLSALVDGQATDLEMRRVLRESESNGELRRLWGRYQMVSAAIRKEVPPVIPVDLTAGIWAAIEAEDEAKATASHTSVTATQPEQQAESRWWSSIGKVAVAASVAGAVIFTSQFAGQSTPDAPAVAVAAPAASSVATLPVGYGSSEVSARTVSANSTLVSGREARAVPHIVVPSQQSPVQVRPSAEVQAYLQRVMELHAVNAAAGSTQGMLPYARIPADAE